MIPLQESGVGKNPTQKIQKKNTVNFTLYIPDGRKTILCDAPRMESSVKTPQGKEHYTVYINYLKEAFNTNEFVLCKETLELYTVVNGLAMETNLFVSIEPIDLDQLHDFLTKVVRKRQSEPQRQTPMDFEDRTNLMESRTNAYCDLIKTVQVFNIISSTNPANAQQHRENLVIQLDPIYTKIKEINTQFSKDDANREHYKLPPFAKPQTQPTEEEMDKESIAILMKSFEAEIEHIKRQMKATLRVNGQAESSTDDNGSSTGSYKGKSTKGAKQTTYCSACGEPGHNASKC